MEFQHQPVLFRETLDALQIRPEGYYIDGTAGGGGHSEAICSAFPRGSCCLSIRIPMRLLR